MSTSDDGDREWEWSEKHQDYYRYQRRDKQVAGKSPYDLVWGRGSIPGPPKAILHLPSAPNPKALPPQNDDIPRTERPSPPQSVDNLSDAYFAEQEPGPLNVRHGSMRVPGFQAPIPIDITLPFRDLNNSSPFPGISRLQGIVRPYPFSELDTPTGEDVESTFYAPTPTSATNPDTNDHPYSERIPELISDHPTDEPEYDALLELDGPRSGPRFERIKIPRNFFRKGKVFRVIWVEPRGEGNITSTSDAFPPSTQVYDQAQAAASVPDLTPEPLNTPDAPPDTDAMSAISKSLIAEATTSSNQTIHTKIRTFVVVRPKGKHALCLPIYTYSLKATSKPSANAEEHAPVVQEGKKVAYHQDEQVNKLKKPLFIIVEDPSIQWNSLSRLNFTKIQTVEYNLRVQKVGRINPDCLDDLETMFREGIGLN